MPGITRIILIFLNHYFMNYFHILCLLSIFIISCTSSNENTSGDEKDSTFNNFSIERIVENNTVSSPALPIIKIDVAEEFTYIGNLDFEIIANSDEYDEADQGKAVAKGERVIFAAVDDQKQVNKLFIIQFEGFLEQNDYTYNYNFDEAEQIGNINYRHNTWFYDSKKLAEENPTNEGAKTRAYLANKGYLLEDEFMMSRFVGLASPDRKNEIILYYLEMLQNTLNMSLSDFKQNLSKEEKERIAKAFVERSRKSFSIKEG